MSNIVTAVKIAVDSGALDAAVDSAKELNTEAGVNLPAGLLKAGAAIGAIGAGLLVAKSHMDDLYANTEATANEAYNLYGTMDSQVRPAMLYVAETLEAQRAQMSDINDLATLAAANTAIGWGKASIEVETAMNKLLYGIEDADDATEKFIRKAAETAAIAAGELDMTSTSWSPIASPEAVERNIAEIKKQMEEFEQAANILSQASADRRIQRLEGINDTARERREKQFEQEIKEREAAIVLAANTSQEAVLEAELKRFKEAQSNFNDYLDEQERLAEQARQTSIENEIKNAEVANMVGVKQLRARHQMEVEALLARKEAGELNALQTEQLRIQAAKKYQAESLSIQDKANADAIKIAEKAATEMSNATSSALSVIDDDLASLYDSIDSLIRVLQLLDGFSALGSGGGFWGIGGAASAGGMSSFGGVSVGTVSVTVQGNTDTVGMKNAAQEGVYGALNGIVKDTMAKESNYGGILNPSSGVHRM